MKKRLILVFVLVCVLGFVSAVDYSCDIKQTCIAGENEFLELSGLTNAHVAVKNSGDYDYKLCCDFPAETGPSDKLIRISTNTNAHAEIPDSSSPVYTTSTGFVNLSCVSDNTGADECSTGYPIEVMSLSASTNAHVGAWGDYDIGICCAYDSDIAPPVPPVPPVIEVGAVYWADMDGNPINKANLGDSVWMIVENKTSGSFTIKEEDTILENGFWAEDNTIKSNVVGQNIGDNLVAKWTIRQEDLDKADNYNDFYFEVGENPSGSLDVNPEVDNSDMVVTITSPACGKYFNESEDVWINVSASDDDDEIDGFIYIDGLLEEGMKFSNGEWSFNKTNLRTGNVNIEIKAVTRNDKTVRVISNIMILDKTGEAYVNGEYVAACILEPEDYSNMESSLVDFNARTTRGVKVIDGVLDVLVPGDDPFSWAWEFKLDGNVIENFNRNVDLSENTTGYIFSVKFPSVGHHSASLEVDI